MTKEYRIYTADAKHSKELTERGYLCIYLGSQAELDAHADYKDPNIEYCAITIPDLMLEDTMAQACSSVYEISYRNKLNKVAEWRIYAMLQEIPKMLNHNLQVEKYEKVALVTWEQPGKRNSRHIFATYMNTWLKEHCKPLIERLVL
jgi:hypothetical protein